MLAPGTLDDPASHTALVYWPAAGCAQGAMVEFAPSVFASPWTHALPRKKPDEAVAHTSRVVSAPTDVPLPRSHTSLTHWVAEGSVQVPHVRSEVELPVAATY